MAAGRSAGRRPLQAPVKALGGPRRKPGQDPSHSPSKVAAYKVGVAGNGSTPGVAVVPADWLLQLRDEVDNVHSTANSPVKGQNPEAPVVSPKRAAPETSPQRAPRPTRRLPARSVGVGSTPPPDTSPSPVRRTDDDWEKERLKTQSTQTQEQQQEHEPEMLAKAIVSPQHRETPKESPLDVGYGRQHREAPKESPLDVGYGRQHREAPKELPPDVGYGSPSSQVGSHISPSGLGRCDIFGNDVSHAERERERRQLQAQMLAEQVEEQRRRKEEEKQRQKQQELEDERRIEREQRELQERHLREQRRGAPPENASHVGHPEKIVVRETLTKPLAERRRPTLEGKEGVEPRRRGAPSQRTTAAANSLTGPWAHPDGNLAPTNGEGKERRRRRRRRTSTSYDTTWRSGNQRTFQETKDSGGYGTPDRGRSKSPVHSKSPTQWLSGTAAYSEVMGSDTVGKIEKELQRTDARQRRRRTRERIVRDPQRDRDDGSDRRERHDRSYESQWMNPPPGRALADTRVSQWEHGDEPRRRRRTGGPERASVNSHQQIHEMALPYDGRMPPKTTEDDLRQQLGSLVSLCQQLLQERAERERSERAPRSERAGGRHSGGRRSSRSDRSLPPAPAPPQMIVGASSVHGEERNSARSHTSHSAQNGRQSGRSRNDVHELGYGEGHSMAHEDVVHNVNEHVSPLRVNGRYPPPMTINEVSSLDDRGWPPDALESLVTEVVHQPPGYNDISPFSPPNARGVSVRRHSQLGYSPVMSPNPVSRGGLNVQANFPGFGRSLLGPQEDSMALNNPVSHPGPPFGQFGVGPSMPSRLAVPGPGHIPIGVRPSIQAQSAMLRELYPHGPNGQLLSP